MSTSGFILYGLCLSMESGIQGKFLGQEKKKRPQNPKLFSRISAKSRSIMPGKFILNVANVERELKIQMSFVTVTKLKNGLLYVLLI